MLPSIQAQRLVFDPREATVDSIHAALFSGQTTCRQVTLSFLARIQELNRDINAIIALNPHCLDVADSLDEQLTRGNTTGALFGVPILLKDNFDMYDMKTTGGCLAFADCQPAEDAPTVKALRDAGAVILGKTNLHEMALGGLSVSSLGGQTLNPYDLSRTPGGSSGGSGAAVAASFAVLATGTDTVNSVRSPASANSLFSCRPTRGLITRRGVMPVSYTQDTVGPIARCVKDVAIALTVMASIGVDPLDKVSETRPRELLNKDYAATVTQGVLRGMRFGLIENLVSKTDSTETTPVTNAMGAAVAVLVKAGAEVISIDDTVYNTTAIQKALDTTRYEYRESLDGYLHESRLSGDRPSSFKQLYSSGKFLVVPEHYEFVNTAHNASTANESYGGILQGISNLSAALQETFHRHRLDALIHPQQTGLVVKLGSASQTARNGILAALTGSPVVMVPAGFSDATEEAPVGVPIGMEILGRPWTEEKLLQIAYQFEQLTHVRRPPALAARLVEVGQLTSVPRIEPDRSNIPSAYPVGVLASS